MEQRDAAFGSMLTAAGVTGAGVLPGLTALVTSAAPVACLSVSVPAPGVMPPVGVTSVATSPGRCERAQESSRPERCRRSSSGRVRFRSGGKCGRGRSPSLLTLPIRPVCLPPLLLDLQSRKRGLVRCLLPPPDILA